MQHKGFRYALSPHSFGRLILQWTFLDKDPLVGQSLLPQSHWQPRWWLSR